MRLLRLLALAIAVAALVPATTASAAEIGLNINGGARATAIDQRQTNLSDLTDLQAKWARIFLFWDDIDQRGLAEYRVMLAENKRHGVKTLLTVASARGQAPDAARYAAFLGDAAKQFSGLADAYEIWNEADEGLFWSGGPNPTAYVGVLKVSYAAIKAVDPTATVVFSPTVGNNFGFLEAAYAAGAKGSFDAMAVHTDTACLDRAPGYFYRETDGRLGRFTFLGYREVREVMEANGDAAKPIWMTEFGWSAARGLCEFGASAGQKPAGVSEADQAKYLLEAMNCLELDPYVEVAMWFNNRDLANDGKMQNMYGLRRFDGSARPAFDAFRTWGTGGGRSGAPCGDFEGPAVKVLTPGPGFVLPPGSNLKMRASSDADDLNRIWFRVEGDGAAPLFRDGPISLPGEGAIREREWGGARDLPLGRHTLVVWATDKNDNAGPEIEIPFAKGAAFATPGPAGTGGLVSFRKLRLQGRGLVRTFRGGSIPNITSGAVRIEWQLKRGRRWKRMHAKAVLARRPFVVRQRLRRAGLWRVRAVYLGRPGIPRTPSCWTVFRTSSTKTTLVCPRGAVRPLR